MAQVTETTEKLLAWCPDPMCPSEGAQHEVDGITQVVTHTYNQGNGRPDWERADPHGPLTQNSFTYYRFAYGPDEECSVCGHPHRQIGAQRRPVYRTVSGQDQRSLQNLLRYG